MTVIVLSFGCSAVPAGASREGRTSYKTTYAAAAKPKGDLRVMSFNIRVSTIIDLGNHWSLRKRLLVDTVREFDPDVLGTQEGLADQADYIKSELRGYDVFAAGRDNGRRGGEMCAIFYKSDRYEKLDGGHFWLSKTPEKPGSKSWGSWFTRMVTWVKLRPRHGGGEEFYVFNTHLDVGNKRARLEQSKLIRQKITQIARGTPVVVTGDFNTDEGSAPYRLLTASAGRGAPRLIDTLRAADPTPERREGTRHGFRGSNGGDRMDWILATPHFATLHADINHARDGRRFPSDHFPVTAVLRLKPAIAVSSARLPAGG